MAFNLVSYLIGANNPARYQIQIEPGWQQLSIPARYGSWNATSNALERGAPTIAKFGEYVLDQLVDKYGASCVEVATAQPGGQQSGWNFFPSTPRGSSHNFPLMVLDVDTGEYEPVGFWIKSTYGSPMLLDVIEWRR